MNTSALLLINMGGPARRNDVEPYLREIFSDPAIIDLPGIVRRPLAGMIARRRADEVADRYESIGGYSPLFHWTESLRRGIQECLEQQGDDVGVEWAFRYMSPTIDETLVNMQDRGIRQFSVLPLFPHYTHTMTGSVMKEVGRVATRLDLEYDYVEDWGLDDDVNVVWTSYLHDALRQAGPNARVIFVAHGIPQLYVKRGDDYPERVVASAKKLAATLPAHVEWCVAYQSKVGPLEWTKPYMEDVLDKWSRVDAPIVMMPLSFVADCLETLYDLDDVARKIVTSNGVRKYVRARVFNDDPQFARALVTVWKERHHVGCR
ncbi:MAG: ferrochelatase [bacterium]|nr:ferrochelatase [bacterium]